MKESREEIALKTAEARICAGISALYGGLTKKQCTRIGDRALELVRDYPLYASIGGITYEEAIAIALVLGVPISDLKKEKGQ